MNIVTARSSATLSIRKVWIGHDEDVRMSCNRPDFCIASCKAQDLAGRADTVHTIQDREENSDETRPVSECACPLE